LVICKSIILCLSQVFKMAFLVWNTVWHVSALLQKHATLCW